MTNRLIFIVKFQVSASMKKHQYLIYIHLCQELGDVLYGKCNCKAGAVGCCKHVATALYQLVDLKERDLKSVPDDKVCTDVLQQGHVPGEAANSEAVLFSNLTFEKSDFEQDKNTNRKRPLVTGGRKRCSSPLFSRKPSEDKIKKLSEGFT